MAKKELLFSLIFLNLFFVSISSFADCCGKDFDYKNYKNFDFNKILENMENMNNNFSENIGNNFLEDLKKKNEEFEASLFESKEKTRLLVFVSFTMPKGAIKSYMKEAYKYGAEIFLQGIPGESIVNFSKIISSMLDDESQGISIDEREFEKYGVKQVPTIVLTKEDMSFERKVPVFDKLLGHVHLKTALELFAKKGDLKEEAEKWLNF